MNITVKVDTSKLDRLMAGVPAALARAQQKALANSVTIDIPEGKDVATLHTHPNGDNTPSPTDILDGFRIGSKAEYIAAGNKLRRWQWLKTPEPEDARLIREYEEANKNGGVDIELYMNFIDRLIANGYIRMEELS